MTLKSGQKSSEPTRIDPPPMTSFLLLLVRYLAKIGLSRIVKRRFQSKIANFSQPEYLALPLKAFPWEVGTDARNRKQWRVKGVEGERMLPNFYIGEQPIHFAPRYLHIEYSNFN